MKIEHARHRNSTSFKLALLIPTVSILAIGISFLSRDQVQTPTGERGISSSEPSVRRIDEAPADVLQQLPTVQGQEPTEDLPIPDFSILVRGYEDLKGEELDQRIAALDETLQRHNLVERANSNQLSTVERHKLKTAIAHLSALNAVRMNRVADQMASNRKGEN